MMKIGSGVKSMEKALHDLIEHEKNKKIVGSAKNAHSEIKVFLEN